VERTAANSGHKMRIAAAEIKNKETLPNGCYHLFSIFVEGKYFIFGESG